MRERFGNCTTRYLVGKKVRPRRPPGVEVARAINTQKARGLLQQYVGSLFLMGKRNKNE